MDLGLTDARVLVSGGSYGIGREIVRVFLAEGARVAVAARGQERLDALCAELAAGDRLVPLAADVGEATQVDALVERAIAALGGLDVLIANATANREGRSDDDYQASFAVDLMQAVRLLEAVRARQPGTPLSVVCTSSIVGKSGDTPEHAYGAMKAALLAFTKNAAVTFGPEGTRVMRSRRAPPLRGWLVGPVAPTIPPHSPAPSRTSLAGRWALLRRWQTWSASSPRSGRRT